MPRISRLGILLFLIAAIVSCGRNPDLLKELDPASEKQYSMIFFVAADCPLCKSYKPFISGLRDSLPSDWAVAVVRTDLPSKINAAEGEFGKEWGDSTGAISRSFGATVTPEVFLIDMKTRDVLYRGAIDNYSWATGKHRTVATEFYLRDAIAAAQKGLKPAVAKTKAIGCFIEQ